MELTFLRGQSQRPYRISSIISNQFFYLNPKRSRAFVRGVSNFSNCFGQMIWFSQSFSFLYMRLIKNNSVDLQINRTNRYDYDTYSTF